ncbi:acyltransferase [Hyphococcus flavus]|uniref:Acyltransferase n=1 Tax=Hyphococcus flavus TaxID=1866326 RepID=A0AAE9ZGU8_9PROT|nr:acyltransferase [Hyphococcus flavus]WDI32302.1 acyltransferase [Hyphococcus flavus]
MQSAHIWNIQALRGIAALMVLVSHINGIEPNMPGSDLLPDQLRIGTTGVDLFFLISGFVMVTVAERTRAGVGGAARFAYNRVARIYPLYWLASLTILIIYLGGEALFAIPYEEKPLVSSFLLAPAKGLPLLTVGWTLIHELYFYVVFSIILLAAPNRKVLMLTFWGFFIIIANIADWTSANPWTKLIFSPLTFEFLTGAFLAYLVKKTSGRWGWPAFFAGLAILSYQAVGFGDREWELIVDHGARAATYTAPFALILYGAAALERAQQIKAPDWLTAIGDASYSLYLFHVPAVMIVTQLVIITLGDRGVADNLIMITACFAAALISAFIIHRLVERPALQLTKHLGDRLFTRLNKSAVRQDRAW